MENSASHRRGNSTSFDSQSDYSGRYLKLFQQQTKNSKANFIANSCKQKIDNRNQLNNILTYKNQPENVYEVEQKYQKQQGGTIQKQLQKMRSQHMRIMRIMDEESPYIQYHKEKTNSKNINNTDDTKQKIKQPINSNNISQQQPPPSNQNYVQTNSNFQHKLSINSSPSNKFQVKQVESKIINQSLGFSYASSIRQNQSKQNSQIHSNKRHQKQILTPATILQDISEEPRSAINIDNNYSEYNQHQQQQRNQYFQENQKVKSPSPLLNSIQKIQAEFQRNMNNNKVDNAKLIHDKNITEQYNLNNGNLIQIKHGIVQKRIQQSKPLITQTIPLRKSQPKQVTFNKQTHVKQHIINSNQHLKQQSHIYSGNLRPPSQHRILQPTITNSFPQQQIINTLPRAISPFRNTKQIVQAPIVSINSNANLRRTTPLKKSIGLPHHDQRIISPVHPINNFISSSKQINNSRQFSQQKVFDPVSRTIRSGFSANSPTQVLTATNFFNSSSSNGFTNINTFSQTNPNTMLNTVRSLSPKPRLMSPRKILQHNQPSVKNIPILNRPISPRIVYNSRPISNYKIQRPVSSTPYQLMPHSISSKNFINQSKDQKPLQSFNNQIAISQQKINQPEIYQYQQNILKNKLPLRPASQSKKSQRGISVSIKSK